MNSLKDTADRPHLALMLRAYCPDWCVSHGVADTPARLSAIDTDGDTVVVHRSRPDSPERADEPLQVREVAWAADGTLVARADTVLDSAEGGQR